MRMSHWTAACGAAILTWALGAAALASPQDGGGEGMGGPAPAPAPAPGAKAPAPSGEDVLLLKDGTEVHGRITAENDTDYAVKVGGTLRVVGKSTVKEVRRGSPPADGGDGAGAGVPPAPGTPGAAPGGEKEKRRARKRGENGQPGEGQGPDGASPLQGNPAQPLPLTDDARAWAKSCIDRLLTADPMVQHSATEALRALGPSVLPVLREARDAAPDEKGKQVLGRVITMIEKGPRPGGDGAPPFAGKRPGPDGAPPGSKPGQPGPDQARRGPALMERVRTELGLDDTQARTVGQALLQFGRDVREVMMDARDGLITYEDARSKGTELRGKLRDGLKSTLTEDQLKKLDGILDEMGKRMGGGPPPGKDGGKKDGPPPAKPGDGAPPPPPDAPPK